MDVNDVVIVSTGQAGTVFHSEKGMLHVLLANHDIWVGMAHQCYIPMNGEDLVAPLNVDRFEAREAAKPYRRERDDE